MKMGGKTYIIVWFYFGWTEMQCNIKKKIKDVVSEAESN